VESCLDDLVARALRALLAIIDGHTGLRRAGRVAVAQGRGATLLRP